MGQNCTCLWLSCTSCLQLSNNNKCLLVLQLIHVFTHHHSLMQHVTTAHVHDGYFFAASVVNFGEKNVLHDC